MPIIPPSFLIG